MGDRCWVDLKCRKSDLTKISQHIWGEDDPFEDIYDETEQWIQGLILEVNYGAWTELSELASEGVPFIVQTGPGGDYGPGSQVSDGVTCAEVEASHNGYPVLEMGAEGVPKFDKEAGRIRNYYEILERAEKIIEGR